MNKTLLREKTNEFKSFIQKIFFKHDQFSNYYILDEANNITGDSFFEPYRLPLTVAGFNKELNSFLKENVLSNSEADYFLKEIVKDLYSYEDDLNSIKLESSKTTAFDSFYKLGLFLSSLKDVIEFINEEIEVLDTKNDNKTNVTDEGLSAIEARKLIVWTQDINSLAYLFYSLKKEGIIKTNYPALNISKIFLNHEEKQIKAGLINKYFSEFADNKYPSKAKLIEEFVANLKKV